MSRSGTAPPIVRLLLVVVLLVVAGTLLWSLGNSSKDNDSLGSATERSTEGAELTTEPTRSHPPTRRLAQRSAPDRPPASLEQPLAPALNRQLVSDNEMTSRARDPLCPPEGCRCPTSICPADESCMCRSDGSLLRSESVSHNADGSIAARRITLFDRDGNPVESTVETFRDGYMAEREHTQYRNGGLQRVMHELFNADGDLSERVEESWEGGEIRSRRRTLFGPDGEPVHALQSHRNDDGTYTTGVDYEGDGVVERWTVSDDDRSAQFFDSEGNPVGSAEVDREGEVEVRRQYDPNGELIREYHTSFDDEIKTTAVVDENGNTIRTHVRDEEAGTVMTYDGEGNTMYRFTRNDDGETISETEVEGAWYDTASLWNTADAYYGTDDSGNPFRLQIRDRTGEFTIAAQNDSGEWVDTARCTFDEDCPVYRPPLCSYTCE